MTLFSIQLSRLIGKAKNQLTFEVIWTITSSIKVSPKKLMMIEKVALMMPSHPRMTPPV